jgi:hypothetical protein
MAMKFSTMVDFKGQPHFVGKTGRKNIRILELRQPYEKSFGVPLKTVSNRRPAEFQQDTDSRDVALGMAEEIEDLEFTVSRWEGMKPSPSGETFRIR